MRPRWALNTMAGIILRRPGAQARRERGLPAGRSRDWGLETQENSKGANRRKFIFLRGNPTGACISGVFLFVSLFFFLLICGEVTPKM